MNETIPGEHWPEYLCELAGTAIMVFIGLSAIAFNFGVDGPGERLFSSSHVRLFLTGLVFSAGGTAVVYSYLGRRSGGHINPAVTFAFCLCRRMRPLDAVLYVASQVTGALIGAFLVKATWGEWAESTVLGATIPGPGVSQLAALMAETFMTFGLILLILLMLSHAASARYTGLAAGGLVVFLVYFGAAISGTGINPARSLAPALITGTFHSLWIYIAGPLLGAALAVAAFRSIGPVRICAKLFHPMNVRCIFCGHHPVKGVS